MKTILSAIGDYLAGAVRGWNRFWFTPSDPATLAVIRICTGAMLFYTHLVWSFDLEAFFGPDGWLPRELLRHGQNWTMWGMKEYHFDTLWSYFWYIKSPTVLWIAHIGALVVFLLLTLGLFSRVMSVLAYLIAVSYVHRVVPGAFFGLDKINCMLAMYLMLGPCGACFSLDRWLKRQKADDDELPPPKRSVGANVALRMIQLHMCVIYLFAGLGKLQGVTWWDGSAVWESVANLEYQSLDMTWLAHWPRLITLMTHVTVFWELFYIVLVWHRAWRPAVLASAVVVHGGIALAMGMITFGLIMLVGNAAFLSPRFVRAALAKFGIRSTAPQSRSERREPGGDRNDRGGQRRDQDRGAPDNGGDQPRGGKSHRR